MPLKVLKRLAGLRPLFLNVRLRLDVGLLIFLGA